MNAGPGDFRALIAHLAAGNSLSVEPLPFHGMSAYPYPEDERYPQTSAHLEYLQDYNTRGIKGYYE